MQGLFWMLSVRQLQKAREQAWLELEPTCTAVASPFSPAALPDVFLPAILHLPQAGEFLRSHGIGVGDAVGICTDENGEQDAQLQCRGHLSGLLAAPAAGWLLFWQAW